jgi:hypothetical protein
VRFVITELRGTGKVITFYPDATGAEVRSSIQTKGESSMSESEAKENAEANDQEEAHEPELEIKDLEASDTEDVKGGPKKIFIGGIS